MSGTVDGEGGTKSGVLLGGMRHHCLARAPSWGVLDASVVGEAAKRILSRYDSSEFVRNGA